MWNELCNAATLEEYNPNLAEGKITAESEANAVLKDRNYTRFYRGNLNEGMVLPKELRTATRRNGRAPIICGIYIIEAIKGDSEKLGWVYVGQAIDCWSRKGKHYSKLYLNKHDNQKLQNYFNKYGEDCFDFRIILECKADELDDWEIWGVAAFDSFDSGFNMTKGGDGGPINARSIKMQNIFTGEIIEGYNRSEFARKYNLNESAVQKACVGKSNYVGDWFNPELPWRPKVYTAISPEGKEFKVFNIYKFCEEHGLTRDFGELLRGKYAISQGWTSPTGRIAKESKKFNLIGPDNKVYKNTTIKEAAELMQVTEKRAGGLFRGEIRILGNGWRQEGTEAKPNFILSHDDGRIHESNSMVETSRILGISQSRMGSFLRNGDLTKKLDGWRILKKYIMVERRNRCNPSLDEAEEQVKGF